MRRRGWKRSSKRGRRLLGTEGSPHLGADGEEWEFVQHCGYKNCWVRSFQAKKSEGLQGGKRSGRQEREREREM